MGYRVERQKSFSDAVAAKLAKNFNVDHFFGGLFWTLERDPHKGLLVAKHVWIAKVLIAPIVVTIYYTIDEKSKV
ncbi:MAG TPA: hypothetical protein VL282_15285, partial [Tepidisphaeraceae bacterium]|nr:hypothetical protein [Tepidisphaeraceae bacterium]